MYDYNTNLLTLLKERESMGDIIILEEDPCVFAINHLLAVSVVARGPVVSKME
jgi:hypothetical protein